MQGKIREKKNGPAALMEPSSRFRWGRKKRKGKKEKGPIRENAWGWRLGPFIWRKKRVQKRGREKRRGRTTLGKPRGHKKGEGRAFHQQKGNRPLTTPRSLPLGTRGRKKETDLSFVHGGGDEGLRKSGRRKKRKENCVVPLDGKKRRGGTKAVGNDGEVNRPR